MSAPAPRRRGAALSIACALGAAGCALYGQDNRLDLYAVPDARGRGAADGVVALVAASSIEERDAPDERLRATTLNDLVSTQNKVPLCKEERFRDQPAAAFCTGVFVAPDRVVTAAHCLAAVKLDEIRFVFGFALTRERQRLTSVRKADVYRGAELVLCDHDEETGIDVAVVRLDREVADHVGLRLAPRDVDIGEPVVAIGHPLGLPLKHAAEARIIDASAACCFTASLDTYRGNSGSPIFDRDYEWIGLLVQGEADFVTDARARCVRSAGYTEEGPAAETVLRATVIADAIARPRFDLLSGRCGTLRLP